ncbi:MAG: thioredoxin family protein, partial [Terriglobales bacterium]
MAVASRMLPLGTAAPEFNLPDVVSGRHFSLADFSREAAWRRAEQSGRPLPTSEARPQPDHRKGVQQKAAGPPAQPLLVMFLCRHCPYVVHVQQELARLGRDYSGRVAAVAISANDAAAYPDDRPESLRQMAAEQGFVFPFLYDESQTTARAYGAACTPDFFLFDASRRLAYRGQLDDSRPNSGRPVTGRDLRAA